MQLFWFKFFGCRSHRECLVFSIDVVLWYVYIQKWCICSEIDVLFGFWFISMWCCYYLNWKWMMSGKQLNGDIAVIGGEWYVTLWKSIEKVMLRT